MRIHWTWALSLPLWIACQNPEAEAEALIEAMQSDTSDLADATMQDTSGWRETYAVFEAAAESVESDSLWARYRLIAGDVQSQVPGGALFAIQTYLEVADSLRRRKEGALALFSVAVTFDEKLGDRSRAVQALSMLMDRYPGTQMAETARSYRDVLLFENDESLLDKIHSWQTNEEPQEP
jgi:hypothetical protein